MSRNGHASASRRRQRSNGRRSNPSDSSASVVFDTASTHPSISDGWAPSTFTSITTPSDVPMNFDPNLPPGQLQGPFFDDASLSLPPHAAFDHQQMDPWQGHPSQLDHNQEYYAASSPEAIDYDVYGSPGNSDDLANSMLVAPGSLQAPSPPWRQDSIPVEGNTARKDSAQDKEKRGSHTREPSVVFSWSPRNTYSTQGAMVEGYTYHQPHYPNHTGLVSVSGFQAPSPYPPVISDADVKDRDDEEQDMANAYYNNRGVRPYQIQGDEEDWDMCKVDDSSCTRRR